MKAIDPTDTYVVRELFACGGGHFLTPGYTHWEAGECCPHGHEPGEDAHLYDRLIMVPTHRSEAQGAAEMWPWMLEHEGKWGQLPLAPKGLGEGAFVYPVAK